jgi:hypothetical protein
MQPVSYTITFSHDERKAIVFALSVAYPKLGAGRPFYINDSDYLALCTRLMEVRTDNQATRQQSGTAAATAVLSRPSVFEPQRPTPAPIEIREHWAKNKKGQETPNPEGCIEINAVITKLEDAPPRDNKTQTRKKLTWESPTGRGFADAYCWDEDLFPHLANRMKQQTTFYIVRSGQYANVVGVRA